MEAFLIGGFVVLLFAFLTADFISGMTGIRRAPNGYLRVGFMGRSFKLRPTERLLADTRASELVLKLPRGWGHLVVTTERVLWLSSSLVSLGRWSRDFGSEITMVRAEPEEVVALVERNGRTKRYWCRQPSRITDALLESGVGVLRAETRA